MTRSARSLNRLILALLGLALVAAGALVLLPAAAPLRETVGALAVGIHPWLVAAAAALFVALALAWVLTRGGGRSRAALRADGVEIDTAAVSSILSRELETAPDVIDVAATAFVRRGCRLVRVAVKTRRDPDLVALRAQVAEAIAILDARLGTPLPLLVHLTTGIRSTFGAPVRAR